MKFGPTESQSTSAPTQSPYDVMLSVAQASGIQASTVTAIQSGMGLTPAEMTPYIVGLAAAQKANPGASPGSLAASVIGANPTQAKSIDTAQKATASKAGQTGAFTDIFGDLFEVVYPFFMFAVGGVLALWFVIIALVAIAKTGPAKAVGGAAVKAATLAAI